MPRVLLILGVLVIVFWVISIVDCAMQPNTRHRGLSKGAWVLIVVLLPIIGGALWFTLGRTTRSGRGVQRNVPRAPDDDPAFLSSLGSAAEQNERIRRLEEELARLDADEASEPPAPKRTDDGTDDGEQRDQRGAVS